MLMVRPSAGAEPVPLWGRLSGGSVFPSCTEEGDLGPSRGRVPQTLSPALCVLFSSTCIHDSSVLSGPRSFMGSL